MDKKIVLMKQSRNPGFALSAIDKLKNAKATLKPASPRTFLSQTAKRQKTK